MTSCGLVRFCYDVSQTTVFPRFQQSSTTIKTAIKTFNLPPFFIKAKCNWQASIH